MSLYLAAKFLHVIGACVLFGTGVGIAFFQFMANRSGEPATIAATLRIVVIADYLFTATAAIAQPVTGALLMQLGGYGLQETWIGASIALYLLIGACWLPVVVIQIRMRDIAVAAAKRGEPLPASYRRLMRLWLWLGWPAFLSMLAILWLMVAKPG